MTALIGCQATTEHETMDMLNRLPGMGVVRLTERTATAACASAVQKAGARSVVLCNERGGLKAQATAALKLPGVLGIELRNEQYFEDTPTQRQAYAHEAFEVMSTVKLPAGVFFTLSCEAETEGNAKRLLEYEPHLKDVVTHIAVHPYDPNLEGPKGRAAQRYVKTREEWKALTGRDVGIAITEFGFCTAPYAQPGFHAVSEAQQGALLVAQLQEQASHPFVAASCIFHWKGYDAPGADVKKSEPFNGLLHFDGTPKPALKLVAEAIQELAPRPAPPFKPTVGAKVITQTGAHGMVALELADGSVLVGLDPPDGGGGGVGRYDPAGLRAA